VATLAVTFALLRLFGREPTQARSARPA